MRSRSCVVHNGSVASSAVPVDDAQCKEVPWQDGALQQLCSVPCPGMLPPTMGNAFHDDLIYFSIRFFYYY